MQRSRLAPLGLALLLVLLSATGAGAGFGAFAYSDQATTEELSASFRIGLLNLGDESLIVELAAEGSNVTSVTFEDARFRLGPSRVTTDPGPGAVHLEGSRYAVPRVIEPVVTIDPGATARNHTVRVTVTAGHERSSPTGTSQRVVREVVIPLRIRSLSERLGPADDGDGYEQVLDTADDQDTPAGGAVEDGSENRSGGVLSILPGGQRAPNDLTGPDQSGREEPGITGTTLALAGGIVLVAGYIIVSLL